MVFKKGDKVRIATNTMIELPRAGEIGEVTIATTDNSMVKFDDGVIKDYHNSHLALVPIKFKYGDEVRVIGDNSGFVIGQNGDSVRVVSCIGGEPLDLHVDKIKLIDNSKHNFKKGDKVVVNGIGLSQHYKGRTGIIDKVNHTGACVWFDGPHDMAYLKLDEIEPVPTNNGDDVELTFELKQWDKVHVVGREDRVGVITRMCLSGFVKVMFEGKTIEYHYPNYLRLVEPVSAPTDTGHEIVLELEDFVIVNGNEDRMGGVSMIHDKDYASITFEKGVTEHHHISDVRLVGYESIQPLGFKVEPAKYNHYFKDVTHLDSIDTYRVHQLFNVTDAGVAHASKKLLCGGQRGAKSRIKDITEARDTLNRVIEMYKEDE